MYVYLFANPTGDRVSAIEPAFVSGDYRSRELRKLGRGVSILRVCKAVHAEAPSVLYNQNIFRFRDRQSTTAFRRAPPLKHCSLMFIYLFLQVIGTQNRRSIAHLELTIGNIRYLYYEGEASQDYRSYINAGKCLGDAFELLSHGHSLKSLELSFEAYKETGAQFYLPHLLRSTTQSRLLQQMMKLNGLVALNFSYLNLNHWGEGRTQLEIPAELNSQCQALKEQLLSPRQANVQAQNRKLPVVPFVNLTALGKAVPTIFHKIVEVSERYVALQEQVATAKEDVAVWKALQDKVAVAEIQIQSWTAEMKSIEQGLEQFENLAMDVPEG